MPTLVEETKEIHADWWAEGEVCVIRRLSYGRKQGLTSTWITVSGDVTNPEMALSDDVIARMNLAILEAGIESMTDPDGQPIAVSAATVYSLDDRDGEFVLAQITALNPTLGRSKESIANFQGGSGDSDADGKQPAA